MVEKMITTYSMYKDAEINELKDQVENSGGVANKQLQEQLIHEKATCLKTLNFYKAKIEKLQGEKEEALKTKENEVSRWKDESVRKNEMLNKLLNEIDKCEEQTEVLQKEVHECNDKLQEKTGGLETVESTDIPVYHYSSFLF